MKKFKYPTGRIYDFDQVLNCAIVKEDATSKEINVKDLSRHMYFTVKLPVVPDWEYSDRDLGEKVLEKYDQGDYEHWVLPHDELEIARKEIKRRTDDWKFATEFKARYGYQ